MEIISNEILNSMTIGIELEFTGITRFEASHCLADFFNTQFHHQGYNHYDRRIVTDRYNRDWQIVYDSSIKAQWHTPDGEIENLHSSDDADSYKCELVTPVLTYDDIGTLAGIMKDLENTGAFVNRSCGIHIHVDGKRFSVKTLKYLINIMTRHEDLLYRALDVAKRRAKTYCKKMNKKFVYDMNLNTIKTFDEIGACWYGESLEEYTSSEKPHYHPSRYVHTNLHSFFKGYGTIEFRCFNSTFDFEVLKAYVEFCLAVVIQALHAKRTTHMRNDNTSNDKFQMRNWLRKLKLNGEEFLKCRQVFLKNLTGNTQYKN